MNTEIRTGLLLIKCLLFGPIGGSDLCSLVNLNCQVLFEREERRLILQNKLTKLSAKPNETLQV